MWERALRAISRPTIAAKGRSYKNRGLLWERALRAINHPAIAAKGRSYNYGTAFFM